MKEPSPGDWRPQADWTALTARAKLLEAVRSFFRTAGYLEVETPLLSQDCVIDRHLEPLVVSSVGRFLQTSPEFGMKRLLAAGAPPIFQIGKVFRAAETGARHNPEFTMLEWYRPGDDHLRQMEVTESLVRHVHGAMQAALGETVRACLPEGPFFRVTYDDAFAAALGTRVLHLAEAELAEMVRSVGETPRGDRDELLTLLLVVKVEPWLARQGAVLLFDYPASQAALARVRQAGPVWIAERFELYLDGIEIANGYHELCDPQELRERQKRQNALRRADGRQELPEHNRLLAAMEAGLPPCAGAALGIDRLLMWLLGHDHLHNVLAFPWETA